MKLLVVSHAALVLQDGKRAGYAPYVKEIDLWMKHVDQTVFACPTSYSGKLLAQPVKNQNFEIVELPEFSLITISDKVTAPFYVLLSFFRILWAMLQADHIHLRCPGNIGLIGCVAQVLLPWKQKSAKYAGNWDPQSNQPLSYRIQRWVLNNTFITKNMKVMVYGNWADNSKNAVPFFTASYNESKRLPPLKKILEGTIRLIFVGTLEEGKRPMLSVQVAEALLKSGINIHLDMFGTGTREHEISSYIKNNHLGEKIKIHGNQPSEIVIEYYRKAHFLIFLSKSEGWPKVVTESLWWGCLPITTRVSCVGELVGNGTRGTLIEPTIESAVNAILHYMQNPDKYNKQVDAAVEWSQQFTVEKFENAIVKLLKSEK
jgi:glycosyltransferase involved in cell wall biosynthesis